MIERLDSFMARANAAYYADHNPFADFTTAPEISQVFGELLGLWCAVVWRAMGSPDPVVLCEAGPGRGTLMQDALRAIGQTAPELRAALRLHLIETAPRLRAIQAARLEAVWHDRLDTVPPGPMLLLANEFLDALPIRQLVRRGTGWCERHVSDGNFVELPVSPPSSTAAEGEVVEIGEAALGFIAETAGRLACDGGAALFVDYGPAASSPGDSLQALRSGQAADPLMDPGQADLTAHVDFEALAGSAVGCAVHGPVPQGMFLTRLGLFQRTGLLARGVSPIRASALIDSARRLAEPDRMGRLFKMMAVCHPGLPQPPGFAD